MSQSKIEKLKRFQYLSDVPDFDAAAPGRSVPPLHVVMLADDQHPASVVQDHINSIANQSGHVYSIVNPRVYRSPASIENIKIDAILIHYSIFAIASTHINSNWMEFLTEFDGIKLMIHEDEYQKINEFRSFMHRVGMRGVFSCLDSPGTLQKVYGVDELSDVHFFSCLPGYIAQNFDEFRAPPLAERPLDIVYRGRILPPQLGRFAQEKREIGERVALLAREHGLKVDISSAEEDRIYGRAWSRFLQSGRAMIGVEGGASIFDFDGQVANEVSIYTENNPKADFEEIWTKTLSDHEGNVEFKTITPKFFEAIASKTALVLYEGRYNGILKPGRHYLPLSRDGSNFDKIAKKLRDLEWLQSFVDDVHDDIMSRPELRMRFYVQKMDSVISCIYAQNPIAKHSPLVVSDPSEVRLNRLVSGTCRVLEHQLAKAQSAINALNEEVSKSDSSLIYSTNNAVTELDGRIELLSQDVQELKSVAVPAATVRELEALRENMNSLRGDIYSTLETFQHQDNALSDRMDALQHQDKALSDQVGALQRQDNALSDRMGAVSSALLDEREAFNLAIAEIDGKLGELFARLQGDLDDKFQRVSSDLKALERSMEQGVFSLESQLEDMRQKAEIRSKQVDDKIDELERLLHDPKHIYANWRIALKARILRAFRIRQ